MKGSIGKGILSGRVVLVFLMIFFVQSIYAQNIGSIGELPFKKGEKLTYVLSYTWGGVPDSAANTRSNTLELKPSRYCAKNVSAPPATFEPLSPMTCDVARRILASLL